MTADDVARAGMYTGLILGALTGWMLYAAVGAALVIATRCAARKLRPVWALLYKDENSLGRNFSELLMAATMDVNLAIIGVSIVKITERVVVEAGATYPFGASYWMAYFLIVIMVMGLASGARFARHVARSW